MPTALKALFTPSPRKVQAHVLYLAVVDQSRKPFLYEGYGVPDTLDGRFDAILLHLFLVLNRLQRSSDTEFQVLQRLLTETFIADMDRSLREMGVGDTGVGKRIKQMGEALLGRLKAYSDAIGNTPALEQALAKNLYRGIDEADMVPRAKKLAQYVLASDRALEQQSIQDILAGNIRFVS